MLRSQAASATASATLRRPFTSRQCDPEEPDEMAGAKKALPKLHGIFDDPQPAARAPDQVVPRAPMVSTQTALQSREQAIQQEQEATLTELFQLLESTDAALVLDVEKSTPSVQTSVPAQALGIEQRAQPMKGSGAAQGVGVEKRAQLPKFGSGGKALAVEQRGQAEAIGNAPPGGRVVAMHQKTPGQMSVTIKGSSTSKPPSSGRAGAEKEEATAARGRARGRARPVHRRPKGTGAHGMGHGRGYE